MCGEGVDDRLPTTKGKAKPSNTRGNGTANPSAKDGAEAALVASAVSATGGTVNCAYCTASTR